MPIIAIDWTEQRSKEEKRIFMEEIAKCVNTAIKVPKGLINVLFRDIPADDALYHTAIFNITWSSHPDRNENAKAEIVKELTARIQETTDIEPERVVFFFHDLSDENVGVAGATRKLR